MRRIIFVLLSGYGSVLILSQDEIMWARWIYLGGGKQWPPGNDVQQTGYKIKKTKDAYSKRDEYPLC